MKTIEITVTATNDKKYQWSFSECAIDENDYGNKRYIAVVAPSGDERLIDCRYCGNYNFKEICADYILNYYGENLVSMSF